MEEAHNGGARLRLAVKELGLSLRSFQRWKAEGDNTHDKRPFATRAKPSFALDESERQEILDTMHKEEFSSLPPSQVVPALADKGIYLGSESTFYRILRDHKQNNHRGRAKTAVKRDIPSHLANAPLEIWVTDISWLRGPVHGVFYYLYFVMDLYSRKIVGYEVYGCESSQQLADVVVRATLLEGGRAPKILHSDNGSPMKGSSLLELCYKMGITTSNSRPRVSDDNPHTESLFRTTKYWPGYPYGGFENLRDSRTWVEKFVNYYNYHHRHSGLKFVTPHDVHEGNHLEVLSMRQKLYETTKELNPKRWINSKVRDWSLTWREPGPLHQGINPS
ncbi:IS3 family transposase [Acidithrix ferrooxidans]|nr:IS3 family transposase [Acidithrix ferrooxidans]